MKTKIIFTLLIAFGLSFQSCEKEENIAPLNNSTNTNVKMERNNKSNITLNSENFESFIEPINQDFQNNYAFVDDFIDSYDNGTLTLTQMNQMLELLNISANTNVDALASINNSNGANTYVPSVQNPRCARLVRVRNAMLDECDNYIWG